MTERSLFWDEGGQRGGVFTEPPSQVSSLRRRVRADELRLLPKALSGVLDDAGEGVLRGHLGDFEASISGGALRASAGRAILDGTVIESDANEDKTPTTPSVGTTGLRLVLRKDWSTGLAGVTLLEAADGTATPPAITQTQGEAWDISLATAEVTTGGVVQNLVDTRSYVSVALLSQLVVSALQRTDLVQYAHCGGTTVGGAANNEVIGDGVQIHRSSGTVALDTTNRLGINLVTGTTSGANAYSGVGTGSVFDLDDGDTQWFLCRFVPTGESDHIQIAGFVEGVRAPVSASTDHFNAFVVWETQFSDAKVYAACGDGTTNTRVDTGVTGDGSAEHLLMIRATPSAVDFWVDGAAVTRITQDIAGQSMAALVSGRLESGRPAAP